MRNFSKYEVFDYFWFLSKMISYGHHAQNRLYKKFKKTLKNRGARIMQPKRRPKCNKMQNIRVDSNNDPELTGCSYQHQTKCLIVYPGHWFGPSCFYQSMFSQSLEDSRNHDEIENKQWIYHLVEKSYTKLHSTNRHLEIRIVNFLENGQYNVNSV